MFGVYDDHAVAYTRRVLELVVVLAEREAALRDHAREAIEELQVLVLELAELTPDAGPRLPRHHGHDRVPAADGDALDVDLFTAAEEAPGPLDDLAPAPRFAHERPGVVIDDRADQVHRVHGLSRRGPDLREHHCPGPGGAVDGRE